MLPMDSPAPTHKPLIELREIAKVYKLDEVEVRALDGVDLVMNRGEYAALIGPSGSGKTSLVLEVLWRALARRLHAAREQPGQFDALKGLDRIDKVILVDQDSIGSTPGSTPATYTGVFDHIRQLSSKVPESRTRGAKAARKRGKASKSV